MKSFPGQVELAIDDFGNSDIARRFGVRQYPAVFIDEVLVATPRDFWDWGSKEPGRYAPWSQAASREAFVADLTELLEQRLRSGSLDLQLSMEAADLGEARLPEIELVDLQGRTLRTKARTGQPVVVAFWAPWCPPCKDSLPWLLSLPEQEQLDVEVLALAVQSSEESVREMVLAHGATQARVAMASTEQAAAFGGVMAVPTLLVFNSEGSLAAVFRGAPPDLQAKVEQLLKTLQPRAEEGQDAAP